jgi:hypothetical protein
MPGFGPIHEWMDTLQEFPPETLLPFADLKLMNIIALRFSKIK